MKKLSQEHRVELLEFLNQDPHINLFLIGDLDMFGFNDEIQSYYGDYRDDKLVAVVFRYRDDSIHIFAESLNDDAIQFIRELTLEIQPKRYMIGEATMNLVGNRLDEFILDNKASTLSVYYPKEEPLENHKVEILKPDDAEEILFCLRSAFDGYENTDTEKYRKRMESEDSAVYGIRNEQGTVVSVGSYTAPTDNSAMIVGVATLPAEQQKGYASALVKVMSDDLLKQGRHGVLFYTNPKAARIYERMGYTPHSIYHMIDLKR